MTAPDPQPLLHESAPMGAARLAPRHEAACPPNGAGAHSPLPSAPSHRPNHRSPEVPAERLEAFAAVQKAPGSWRQGVVRAAQSSGRSQFAAVLLSCRATGPTTVSSAGTEPVADVEPNLAQVPQKVGGGASALPNPSRWPRKTWKRQKSPSHWAAVTHVRSPRGGRYPNCPSGAQKQNATRPRPYRAEANTAAATTTPARPPRSWAPTALVGAQLRTHTPLPAPSTATDGVQRGQCGLVGLGQGVQVAGRVLNLASSRAVSGSACPGSGIKPQHPEGRPGSQTTTPTAPTPAESESAAVRIARLEAALAAEQDERRKLETERNILRQAAKYFAGETNW